MKQSNMQKTFKFVIRDDDLCFFSAPEHIVSVYQQVFDQNIPVSFSTIPFINLPNDAWLPRPLPVESETGEFPISDNARLVEYVNSNPLIEITQHGCTHQTPGGIFEYVQTSGLYEATVRGKEELERTFGKSVNVFVAPHDQFSAHGIRAIEYAGLNIVRGKGVRNFLPRCSYISALFKMAFHIIRFKGVTRSMIPAYPHTLNLGEHREAFGIRIESRREDLFTALALSYATGGNFVLVNHIHDFNDEKKLLMLDLIKKGQELGATFVTASNLFS